MKVIAGGRIAVFPRDGAYQLYCTSLTPEGVGDLHVAFEQLKLKLQAEGLFARERKQALPRFPHRIAIITSSAGAALHDMLRILRKRYPLTEVKLLGVRVRGPRLRRRSPGRSATPTAGSWPTSSSPDAAAAPWRTFGPSTTNAWPAPLPIRIFRSSRPSVMSQMLTISDFVADLRAATPSNAAELAVPDQTELRQHLAAQRAMLLTLMTRRLKQERQRVAQLAGARALRDPKNYIDDRRMQLDYTQRRLIAALQRLVAQQRERFVRLTSKLDAMSPLKVPRAVIP